MYRQLAEFQPWYDHIHEAYQLYNALLPGNHELRRVCCRCGISMVDAARLTYKDGNRVVALARDVEKQAATLSDDDIHAKTGEGSG